MTANKENEQFSSMSDEAMENLIARCVPDNIKKMAKWFV